MSKLPLSSLASHIGGEPVALLVGIGFDERSLVIAKALKDSKFTAIIGILNPVRSDFPVEIDGQEFTQTMGESSKLVGKNCRNVMETIDKLQTELKAVAGKDVRYLVDITSLSHELLVAMIGLFNNEGILSKSSLLYTTASEYSYNHTGSSMWLSRGVTDIRSILGFPGVMLPSRKLHLIIMAGFEVERAAEVILRYEPNRLTIASGGKDSSISTDHHKKNSEFTARLKAFIREQNTLTENLHQFEFSCVDPFKTSEEIIEYAKSFPGENIVICPLNTKLSTVGATLAALKMPEIQICYAQAAEYNIAGYARSGNEVKLVDFNEKDIY